MSAPTQTPRPAQDKTAHRPRRDQARSAAMVVLAILITLFAVLNTEQVKVDWIVGSAHAPLIIVIVVSLLVGIALTYFTRRRGGRKR